MSCYHFAAFLILGERLSDFYISVGNTSDGVTFDSTTFAECWYQGTPVGNGETRKFSCTEVVVGRYVAVYFPTSKSQYLQLCEVEVHSDIGIVLLCFLANLCRKYYI